MAPLMFVTELTGRASILMRPPDISSTMPFQSRNISWKMSLPAQPDWIFHVYVCAVATPPPAPAAGDELAPPPAPGAFCGRQAAMNAPIAESEKYLRNPRREAVGNFTIRTSHFPPSAGSRDHSIPAVSACQATLFAWRHRAAILTYVGGPVLDAF